MGTTNYVARFNKTGRRLHKYNFLGLDMIRWVTRSLDVFFCFISSLQNNSTFIARRTVTSKKKGYTVIGCKFYQIGLTTVAMNFGDNFKFVRFASILSCLAQDFCLDSLYIKVLCLNIKIFSVEGRSYLLIVFGLAAVDITTLFDLSSIKRIISKILLSSFWGSVRFSVLMNFSPRY